MWGGTFLTESNENFNNNISSQIIFTESLNSFAYKKSKVQLKTRILFLDMLVSEYFACVKFRYKCANSFPPI